MHGAGTHPPDPITVLHVDGYPAFTELTAELLAEHAGSFEVEVETARFADEALAVVDEGQVDCVVSGYDLPKTDGLAFMERVRGTVPRLPFVLFTAHPRELVEAEALRRGATAYLQKTGDPGQYDVLADRIESAVGSQPGPRTPSGVAYGPRPSPDQRT